MATTPLVESHLFTVHPATHARFDDVRTMVGPKNPTSSACWCLSHRIPARDNQSLVGPERAAFVEALTRKRIKPGVLAYDGDEVVGWAAVAPRADLPFAKSTKIPHVDDLPVWSVWCIRVRPGHRGRGISHVLLAGATAYVGTRKLFEDAGFELAARTEATSAGFPRVIMRATPSRWLAR